MPQDFVCVGRFSTPELAHVARLSLEAEGIQAFLDNEWVSSMDWALTDAVGGVKLLVGSLDAGVATEILSVQSRFKWEDQEDEQHDSEREWSETRSSVKNEREEDVLRAFRGAVLGLLFLPVQFYVFYLLLFKVLGSDLPLNSECKYQLIVAVLINIPSVVIMLLFMRSLISPFGGL